MPTDKEMFDTLKEEKKNQKKSGRPSFNRELAYAMLAEQERTGKPSTRYIKRALGNPSNRSLTRIREEMKAKKLIIEKTDYEKLDQQVRKFDEECKEAMGISFYDWCCSKMQKSSGRQIFRFCERIWEEIWNKPIIYGIKDRNSNLADQLAMDFLKQYGEDTKRIRGRKKKIRRFFAFMGREDINNRHLTMSRARDPVNVREVPEISFTNFPVKLQECIDEMESYGLEYGLIPKIKICTQMRTGSAQANRELWGITVGEANHTYLIMEDANEYTFKISAKMNETWTINWLPKSVRKELYQLYQMRDRGERLIQISVREIREKWKEITKKHGLPPLNLHDLRKISITWFYIMGIPLEIATDINVGWRDLNTAKDYYLQFRKAIKREVRESYKANIPEWFKEGLDEYLIVGA